MIHEKTKKYLLNTHFSVTGLTGEETDEEFKEIKTNLIDVSGNSVPINLEGETVEEVLDAVVKNAAAVLCLNSDSENYPENLHALIANYKFKSKRENVSE